MVDQLEEYARGEARDIFWDVAMKDPGELDLQEKQFILENFVQVHPETMLRPHPRFAELADRVTMAADILTPLRGFTAQDWMDLQVWFFLAWTGPGLRRDPRVRALLDKGKGFVRGDKVAFGEAIREHLADILPLHRRLAEEGTIEVACSPMYHPILPLLVDSRSALEAAPTMKLPNGQFCYPGDAGMQVQRGLEVVGRHLGRPVGGMWPSEGSVSTAVLEILGQCGVRWIATDEKILFNSLGAAAGQQNRHRLLCQPWKMGETAIFFRNTELSDLIGFVYSRWEPARAAEHFASEVLRVAEGSGLERPVVTIAMDGENAWEYFVHGGLLFVEQLYRHLQEDGRFRLVTPSQVLDDAEPLVLDRLCAGSWIGGTFHTWMGDPVKNRAWDHLLAARQTVETWLVRNHVDPREREELVDLVLRAEASDWFWWYGEGHTSIYDVEFDLLFREHLKAIYTRIGMRPPAELDQPLDPSSATSHQLELPAHLIRPEITGRHDSYYKWLSAGRVSAERGFLHRPTILLREMRFGFDEANLYLRVEASEDISELMAGGRALVLHLVQPVPRDIALIRNADGVIWVAELNSDVARRDIEVQAETVLEMRIPFDAVGREGQPAGRGSWVELCISVTSLEGWEEERFPQAGNVVFQIRGEELNAENWHV
jgi:alpha-amylase/alpha-mannosidase (GH57 family)